MTVGLAKRRLPRFTLINIHQVQQLRTEVRRLHPLRFIFELNSLNSYIIGERVSLDFLLGTSGNDLRRLSKPEQRRWWRGGCGRRRRHRVCLPASSHQDYIESITMALLRCTGRCRNGTRWCAPLRPRAAANIAAAAGYSGRGRRPAAATPSARLFSEHYFTTYNFFANEHCRCQRTRSFSFLMSISGDGGKISPV